MFKFDILKSILLQARSLFVKKHSFYLKILLLVPLLVHLQTKPMDSVTQYIPEYVKQHPYQAALFTVAGGGISYAGYQYLWGYEKRWNWKDIDESKEIIIFPNNFLLGTGSSALQTEGRKTDDASISNSWTASEEEMIEKNGHKQPRVPEENRVGEACHHWDLYKEDIQLAADFGFNAYRYSIEWSKIEIRRGVFDEKAMQHYIDYTWQLVHKGLKPIPTLFHHAWPLWLEHGFETEEAIFAFTEFARYVFKAFKEAGLLDHVKIWLTFNEPAGYALAGYVHGKYPPHKKINLQNLGAIKQCGIVLKNMLDAHVAVYDAFKEIDSTVNISLAHMMQPIKPYNPWNPLDQFIAKTFDFFLNDVTLIYLQTGNYTWPLLGENNSNAKGKLDFIGVNYYTYTLLKNFKEAKRPTDILAGADEGSQKAIYAEGFYESIKRVVALMPNVPIMVTENGLATDDPKQRTLYFKRHLYVIRKLLDEEINIYGYLIWTLTDCFGWNSGNNSKYGLFAVDWKTQERSKKKGTKFLKKVVQQSKESLEKLPEIF